MTFFTNSTEKRSFTQDLFRRLAPRYELVNIVMSMGQVGFWRRIVAKQAALPPGGQALDVATGAGALARAIARRSPGARVVGVDFTAAMVRVAHASTVVNRRLPRATMASTLGESGGRTNARISAIAASAATFIQGGESRRKSSSRVEFIMLAWA